MWKDEGEKEQHKNLLAKYLYVFNVWKATLIRPDWLPHLKHLLFISLLKT